MKFALHTSTAISSVLKEPEHFYVDIYYLIILIIVAFTLLLLSFLRYHPVSYTHLTLPTKA